MRRISTSSSSSSSSLVLVVLVSAVSLSCYLGRRRRVGFLSPTGIDVGELELPCSINVVLYFWSR